MQEMKLDQAWNNVINAVYAFVGNRKDHELLEQSVQVVKKEVEKSLPAPFKPTEVVDAQVV